MNETHGSRRRHLSHCAPDGLSDMVDDPAIAKIVSADMALEHKAIHLVDLANEMGPDNISVLWLRCMKLEKRGFLALAQKISIGIHFHQQTTAKEWVMPKMIVSIDEVVIKEVQLLYQGPNNGG